MQTIVREVLHLFRSLCLRTEVFDLLCIIGDGQTECIDRFHSYTFYNDLNRFILRIAFLVGTHLQFALYRFNLCMRHSVLQINTNGRDVVGVNQSVAIDVASADISLVILVAFSHTGIVHIRHQVVPVDLVVMIDVAWNCTFRSRLLENIEFSTGTEITDSLRDVHLDVSCLWLIREEEFLRHVVAVPFERPRFCPILFVHAVGNVSFQDRSCSGILPWQILEFVDRVIRVQVHNQVEWHGLRAVIGMPEVTTFIEVEQMSDLHSFHFFRRDLSLDALDGKFQRIHLGFGSERVPFGMSVLVHGTQFKLISRLRQQVLELQEVVLDGRIKHVLELDLIIIGIADLIP